MDIGFWIMSFFMYYLFFVRCNQDIIFVLQVQNKKCDSQKGYEWIKLLLLCYLSQLSEFLPAIKSQPKVCNHSGEVINWNRNCCKIFIILFIQATDVKAFQTDRDNYYNTS